MKDRGIGTRNGSGPARSLATRVVDASPHEAQLPGSHVHLSAVRLRKIWRTSGSVVCGICGRKVVLYRRVAVEEVARWWSDSLVLGAELDALLSCCDILAVDDSLEHLE